MEDSRFEDLEKQDLIVRIVKTRNDLAEAEYKLAKKEEELESARGDIALLRLSRESQDKFLKTVMRYVCGGMSLKQRREFAHRAACGDKAIENCLLVDIARYLGRS